MSPPRVALDEDFHVHSTFSDGASTLAENVQAARERGLRTLCLSDHVRRDTTWVPDFAAAVRPYRHQAGLRVLAGVEAKILDSSGKLDIPPDLARCAEIDLVLIADHQFPADDGPVHPDQVRAAISCGRMTAAEAIERLCLATANALRPGALVAHLFSLLPKIGLDETMVPASLLGDLAGQAARAGVLVEVNEKWSCPSARTLAAMADAGVRLVAGSDSHHRRDVGVYCSVRQTAVAADLA
ncbi:MAG TPA: PHP domain-containing protein [Streptosporangiaceae bacterium]|nr:PHP domain-containing protein [Streptosporangiaceae bacterium]